MVKKLTENIPDWFKLTELAISETMERVSESLSSNNFPLQVKNCPLLAHWFVLDSLSLANQANREGMHANALVATRQCIEAISVIELGICGHPEAHLVLSEWEQDKITPGKLRAWLQDNVWISYGSGLWNEPWAIFMREFAKSIQSYAHYGRDLAQWQMKLQSMSGDKLFLEIKPRAYDPQKATRITLYHALLTYILGRQWLARNQDDKQFGELIREFGKALGKSYYFDGNTTNWSQQFWAMLWDNNGNTILE